MSWKVRLEVSSDRGIVFLEMLAVYSVFPCCYALHTAGHVKGPGRLYLNKIWVRIKQSDWDSYNRLLSRSGPTQWGLWAKYNSVHHNADPQHHAQGEHAASETLRQHLHDRPAGPVVSQHHHYRHHRLLLCLLPRLLQAQPLPRGADAAGVCRVRLHKHCDHGERGGDTRLLLRCLSRWRRPPPPPPTRRGAAWPPVMPSSSLTESPQSSSSWPAWSFSFRLKLFC